MLRIIKNIFLNKYFLKFVIVGIIATIINYSFFYYLYQFLLINYIISSTSGYILGLIIGFLINKFWTYESKSKISFKESLLYLSVYMFSLVLGLIFLKFQVEYILIPVLIANFFTIGLTTLTNYVGTRFLVFKIK